MNTNKPDTINRNRQAIAGIKKHFSNVPTILLDGVPTKPDDAIATLQAPIDEADESLAAETARHTAVAAEKKATRAAAAVRTALKTLVFTQFGRNADAVTDFGFEKPKRREPGVKDKAEAAAKREATREARHTMGPKAKGKIKGAPPAPATPPKPAT